MGNPGLPKFFSKREIEAVSGMAVSVADAHLLRTCNKAAFTVWWWKNRSHANLVATYGLGVFGRRKCPVGKFTA